MECYECRSEINNGIATSIIKNNTKIKVVFCPNCQRIIGYKKSFFRDKAIFSAKLTYIVNYLNDIADITQINDYKKLLEEIMYLPKDIIDFLFENDYLVVDDFGIRTNKYDYQICDWRFSDPPSKQTHIDIRLTKMNDNSKYALEYEEHGQITKKLIAPWINY